MRKKLELIVTNNGAQEIIELSLKPILIGNHSSCQIQTPLKENEEPGIKAVLQNESDTLKVQVFSKDFALQLHEKKYKSAVFKDSVYFKLGPIDVVLNIEEVESEQDNSLKEAECINELDDLQDYKEEIPSEFAAETTSPRIPLPASAPLEVSEKNEPLAADLQEKEPNAFTPSSDDSETKEEVPEAVSEEDQDVKLEEALFSFQTIFDESHYQRKINFSYAEGKFDFSDYIDPEDETVNKLPTENFVQQNEALSAHVAHLHNGTTLSDRYFSLEKKKIFISNRRKGKNYFQAHDWEGAKDEFIHNRNGKTIVVRLKGYKFQKVTTDERLIDLSGQTAILNEDERIVLSNETSQIVVQLSKQPPMLKKDSPLDLDEQLIKILACVWAFFLIPMLGIMLAVDLPKKQEKPKELVVILKKTKTSKKAASASSSASSGQKAPSAQKSKEPQKTAAKKAAPKQQKKVAKTPPKKAPAKPTPKKVAAKPKAAPAKAPVKKVVKAAPKAKSAPTKRAAPAKKAPKTYSFNSASKMKSLLGGKLRGVAGSAAGEKVEVSVSGAVGSNTIKNESGAGLGSVSNSVAKFATSGSGSGQAAMGSRGLSGKSGTDTTYAEGNAKVLGSLDPNLIRKIMREYIPQFRYCYQKELMKDEQVAGVFDLNFYIDRYGKGIKVSVDSQGKGFSRAGVNCLQKVVSMITFPKPPGGNLVDVKQPLNFQQNRKAAGSF